MPYNKAIQKLGLNSNQIKVYVTLLQMGSASIQEISKKTRIKRTTTYSILDNLIHKNLITMLERGAHRKYIAEDPKKIPRKLEENIQKLENDKKDLINIIPELSSLYNIDNNKPKIKYYEGLDGIKQLYAETLLLKKGEETLSYASAELNHKYLDEYITSYVKRRAQKGIPQRCITLDSHEGRMHQKNDISELRKTRLVDPKIYPFSNEINIFRNKIFIASFPDLLGVLIESASIAKTQKAIFELAWLGAREVKKIKTPKPSL